MSAAPASTTTQARMGRPLDVEALRRDFPVLARMVNGRPLCYLDSAASSQRPQFVIDAPNGGGKVPMNPQYITKIDDEAIHFKNFEGKLYRYPLKSYNLSEADEGCGCSEAEIMI